MAVESTPLATEGIHRTTIAVSFTARKRINVTFSGGGTAIVTTRREAPELQSPSLLRTNAAK